MVVCQNKKYALVSSTGDMVIRPVLDDAYMTISSGKKYYYMNVGDRKIDIIEFLDEQSPNITKNSSNETNNNTTSENKSEEKTSTETNN